ncbi:MAG: lysoplasmalogenase [Deinococcales bacterium]
MIALVILLTSSLAIYGKYQTRWLHYLFKPLATLSIMFLAFKLYSQIPSNYGLFILIGLALSLAGDVFLMLPKERFIWGLMSFLLAHVAYIIAFSQGGLGLNIGVLLALIALGIIVLSQLYPWVESKLKIPVIIYVTIILLMAYAATGRYLSLKSAASSLAMLGAYAFVLSDSLLAFNRFRKKFGLADVLVLASYYLAQWLIALSIH